MVIEKHEKITQEEAKEITILMANARQLMRDPMKKLSDMFSFCLKACIFGSIGLVLCVLLIIFGDADLYVILCMGVMIAMLLMVFVYYRSMRKLYLDLINQANDHVTITLDEEGVGYDDHGTKKLKLFWKNISFVRAFQHVVCFFPNDVSGIMITIDRAQFASIKQFLQENNIDVQIID
ncbi:MAG: hypothetical protein IK081_11005 [Lachnospiraceae bacterium]|nr:hypothetical protein [Lachnospiraceae bacterium]